jgi:hypothetical protein
MCPYARRALASQSIKVWSIDDHWDLETVVDTFQFKPWAVEIVICPQAEWLDEWAHAVNQRQTRITALADDPSRPGDIAGHNPSNQKFPLIILQDREDLLAKRHILSQTNYYSTWSEWYKRYVMG